MMSYDPSHRKPPRQERWPNATPPEGWPSHRDGDAYRGGEQADSRYGAQYGAERQGAYPATAGYRIQSGYGSAGGYGTADGYGDGRDGGYDWDADRAGGYPGRGYTGGINGYAGATDDFAGALSGYGSSRNGYAGTIDGYTGATDDFPGVTDGFDGAAHGYRHAAGDYGRAVDEYPADASGYDWNENGYASTADGYSSAADGYGGAADGYSSAADGYGSAADGYSSAADGYGSAADGYSSAADGYGGAADDFRGYPGRSRGGYAEAAPADPRLIAPDAGVRPDRWQADQDSRREARQRGPVVGAVTAFLAVAVAIGVSTLAAAFVRPQASPITVVGGVFVDRTPTALRNFAVHHFGTHGRTVLLLGMYATLALVALLIGVLARREAALGVAAIGAFSLFGAFVAMTRPEGHVTDVAPSVIGGLAGVAALLWLVRASAPPQGGAPLRYARGGSRRRAR